MATPEKANEWRRWLAANGCGTWLAMATGQDDRVLRAIDACWHAYAVADEEGRRSIWAALVNLFQAMQPKCWPIAIELAARAMDWSDREEMRRQMLMYTAPDAHRHLEVIAR